MLVLLVAVGWLLGVGGGADEADLSRLSIEELMQVRIRSEPNPDEAKRKPSSCSLVLVPSRT